ncbi:MAG: TlpA family protein disulfide reductase [Phocaeicola sp.]
MKKTMNVVRLTILSLILTFGVSTLYAQKVKKGAEAPAFSYEQLGTKKQVALSDFKGKYVLIDFWASWCPPCHAAAPFLKEVYEKQKANGFEILGVSLDKNEAAWEKAVESKELNWVQVRADDAGAHITKLYSFNSIPYFVLVDPNGKVIAEGFQANELATILTEAMGK